MECMGNQEDTENDFPLLPKSYEEFCEMFSLEEVELNIPPVSEKLFEDNQYSLLDGSDSYIPQCITKFFQLCPLYATLFLPDDMF
ncbi:uncharacterized protein DS421_4g110750 [Arachis hypogaea]|nr:uncharacterized protein DS421_4g110750 [Arachis hypogaea]